MFDELKAEVKSSKPPLKLGKKKLQGRWEATKTPKKKGVFGSVCTSCPSGPQHIIVRHNLSMGNMLS